MSIYRHSSRVIAFTPTIPKTWTTTPSGGGGTPVGGKTMDVYGNIHSLHNHAHPPSAQHSGTRVANWVKWFSLQAPNGGNSYTFGGMFLGVREPNSLPPAATATHEAVSTPYVETFPSGWASSLQQVDLVEFVPNNFEILDYDPDATTNLGASIQQTYLNHIDAWQTNAPNPNRRFVIYTNWPETRHSGNATEDLSQLTAPQLAQWHVYAFGHFQTWMELLVSRLQAARPTLNIGIHNINLGLMSTLRDTVIGTIPMTTLFEDRAPHGRSTVYCIAAIAEYIELFNEKPPANFVFPAAMQADPNLRVHQTLVDNFAATCDHIWGVLRP